MKKTVPSQYCGGIFFVTISKSLFTFTGVALLYTINFIQPTIRFHNCYDVGTFVLTIMNSDINKYFTLMGMIMLSALGFVGVVIALFFILKLFSIALFNIPGSDYIYAFLSTSIPYFILFGAYYIVHRKISHTKINAASVASRIILTAGSLICIAQLVVALLWFFKITPNWPWLEAYRQYNGPVFALHLVLILIAAGVLATGDPKEKSWLERKPNN